MLGNAVSLQPLPLRKEVLLVGMQFVALLILHLNRELNE